MNKKSIDKTSALHGRLGKQPQRELERVQSTIYQRPAVAPPSAVSNFSIRGRSNTVVPSQGLSIRGESGPTLVLVTGLDPGTNDDDVRVRENKINLFLIERKYSIISNRLPLNT